MSTEKTACKNSKAFEFGGLARSHCGSHRGRRSGALENPEPTVCNPEPALSLLFACPEPTDASLRPSRVHRRAANVPTAGGRGTLWTGGTAGCMVTGTGEPTIFAKLVEWQRELARHTPGTYDFKPFEGILVSHVGVYKEAAVIQVSGYRDQPPATGEGIEAGGGGGGSSSRTIRWRELRRVDARRQPAGHVSVK